MRDHDPRPGARVSGRHPGAYVLILALSALTPAHRISAAGTPATLGDVPEVFTAALGKPLHDNGTVKSYGKCAGSEDGTKWGIVFGIRGDSKGGFVHPATAIERHACGGEKLDSGDARKEARGMMPSDARLVRDFTTSDGRHAQEYRSSSLGKALPPDHFTTCSPEGKVTRVPEGTFSFALARDGRTWDVVLGTCF